MAKDPAVGPITRYDKFGNARVDRGEALPVVPVEEVIEYAPEKKDMKTIILAGGHGTRLQDETEGKIPKPLVKIGLMTMLQHIIYLYEGQGNSQFIVAGGYKADALLKWREELHDVFGHRELNVLITDTGVETQTGGRLLRLKYYLSKPFMMTYGDGLSDINLSALAEFHDRMVIDHNILVTLTAVRPPARFGNLVIENGLAKLFVEKSQATGGWINGGFYIIQPDALNLISGDSCRWEYDVLPTLAIQGRLAAYQHTGYFQMCDTSRDLESLRSIWELGNAPWARLFK